MRHGIQFTPPAASGLLAEWLRYAQVLSIDDNDQVRVWVPKGTSGAKQVRPDLWAVEFQLPTDQLTFFDKLYQLGVISGSPRETNVWCPKGIGRPKVWQQQNIGRLASYGVTAVRIQRLWP